MNNVWLVGIPELLDTTSDNSWNFVYSSEEKNITFPTDRTGRYGEQVLQFNDPFNKSETDEYLKICYMFVSNLKGTSAYEEVGNNSFNIV